MNVKSRKRVVVKLSGDRWGSEGGRSGEKINARNVTKAVLIFIPQPFTLTRQQQSLPHDLYPVLYVYVQTFYDM